MSESSTANVVGIQPWLPWPLSAWPAWTAPVRAERLALLRIGVALCVLVDIGWQYAPHTLEYFGKHGLGDPTIFRKNFEAPYMTWSLLRGFGDDVILYLALTLWIAMTIWIAGTSLARFLFVQNPPADDRTGIAVWLWTFGLTVYTLALWGGMTTANAKTDVTAWAMPLVGFSGACLFWVLELATRLRDNQHRVPWLRLALPLAAALVLALLGYGLTQLETIDDQTWWLRILRPWQDHDSFVIAAMIVWTGAAICLLFGSFTRIAAILTWVMSMSFANANPYLDNAGDTIRQILLFYLMLCPCGAVWSLDAVVKKPSRPVYVHPWPICLIFTQMIFMYTINGVYKIFGEPWRDGESLYFVLGDLTLARASVVRFPIPLEISQYLTWSVLAWELAFPFLAIFKWTRWTALVFGVFFHLGILATMELGMFAPYALCMYLPLIPWRDEREQA
jgi:hypothetical protein